MKAFYVVLIDKNIESVNTAKNEARSRSSMVCAEPNENSTRHIVVVGESLGDIINYTDLAEDCFEVVSINEVRCDEAIFIQPGV